MSRIPQVLLSCVLLSCGFPLRAEMEPPECPTIYVSLDVSPQSQLLHAWYDRPWSDSLNPQVQLTESDRDKLEDLEGLRAALVPHLVVADWDDWDLRQQHQLPEATDPMYRVGRYGKWEPFPEACWHYPELSLVWLDYVRRSWSLDFRIEQWESQCERACYATELTYHARYGWTIFLFRDGASRMELHAEYVQAHREAGSPRPMPVVAYRPHPRLLCPNPLEDWQ